MAFIESTQSHTTNFSFKQNATRANERNFLSDFFAGNPAPETLAPKQQYAFPSLKEASKQLHSGEDDDEMMMMMMMMMMMHRIAALEEN
jgi:hypothetical protein